MVLHYRACVVFSSELRILSGYNFDITRGVNGKENN